MQEAAGLAEEPDDGTVEGQGAVVAAPSPGRGDWLRLSGTALTDFARNNCPYVAAGIAYWTVLSLFPLALAGVSLLGFLYPNREDQQEIVHRIISLIPVSADYLTDLVNEVASARGTLGVVAIAGLLFTGTAVFSAVRKGVNHAWHIGEPQYFVLERAIDLLMLVGLAVLAVLTVVFVTSITGLASVMGIPEWLVRSPVARVPLELGALAVTWGVLAVLYRYVPNTTVSWRDVLLGAFMAAVLFQGVRHLFAWFVGSMGGFNLVYGSLGSLMAVLVWAYLTALAVMWGAQVSFTCRQAAAGLLPASASQQATGTGDHQAPTTPLGLLKMVGGWLLPPSRRRP